MTSATIVEAGRHDAVSSFLWLNAERVARLVLGVVQTGLVARYLGPEWFGEISGSLAFVGLFAGCISLGLDAIVSRRLALVPREARTLLGTALALRVVSGAAVTLGLLVFASGDDVAADIRMVVALTAIAQAPQIGESWFSATGRQRKASVARLGVFVVAMAARIVLIAAHGNVIGFAVLAVVEIAVSSLLVFIWASTETGGIVFADWRRCAPGLLGESWPVIVSMIGVGICTRFDLVIVSRLLPGETTGSYAAAVRLNELLQFVAAAIPGATLGLMVRLHRSDRARFREVQAAIAAMAALAGLVISLVWVAFGELGILAVFGDEYRGAGPILRILAWSNVAVFAGSAWSVFWLANGLQSPLMRITAISALVTLGTSALMIVHFGAVGAAWSIVAGQFLPFVLLQAHREARAAFREMIVAAFRPRFSLKLIASWLAENRPRAGSMM